MVDPRIEIRDVAPGLWLWRQHHWEWREGDDWEPDVASFVVESGGETILLDPLAPPPIAGHEVYERLERRRPTMIVVLKPDHVRDVDLFAHWYGIPAHGPWLYWPGEAPRTELRPIFHDEVLPGGLVALFDGRGGLERPLYLPEQRAIVFADGMAAPRRPAPGLVDARPPNPGAAGPTRDARPAVRARPRVARRARS